MEMWDLYDKDKNMLERKAVRGEKLNKGEFHLVVNVWIENDKNELLVSQRAANRTYPLQWECTGGSALMGETSIDAAIREAKEELGIDISKGQSKYIGSTLRYYPTCDDILEVWLFRINDADKQEIIIQKEEVNDAKWLSREEIRNLYNQGKFEANTFFDEVVGI